ncbi:hypothetical protein L1887_55516 [Cichorium endivia]|nr:hypothetical protein L1887_55516 [Cichorium endivia]
MVKFGRSEEIRSYEKYLKPRRGGVEATRKKEIKFKSIMLTIRLGAVVDSEGDDVASATTLDVIREHTAVACGLSWWSPAFHIFANASMSWLCGAVGALDPVGHLELEAGEVTLVALEAVDELCAVRGDGCCGRVVSLEQGSALGLGREGKDVVALLPPQRALAPQQAVACLAGLLGGGGCRDRRQLGHVHLQSGLASRVEVREELGADLGVGDLVERRRVPGCDARATLARGRVAFQHMRHARVKVAADGKVAKGGGEAHVEAEGLLDVEPPRLEDGLVGDLECARRLGLEVLERLLRPGLHLGRDVRQSELGQLHRSLAVRLARCDLVEARKDALARQLAKDIVERDAAVAKEGRLCERLVGGERVGVKLVQRLRDERRVERALGRKRAEAVGERVDVARGDVVRGEADEVGLLARDARAGHAEVLADASVEAGEHARDADVGKVADAGLGHGKHGALGSDAEGRMHREADTAAHGDAVHDRDKGLGLLELAALALGERACVLGAFAGAVRVGRLAETRDLVVELELGLEKVEGGVAHLCVGRVGGLDDGEHVAAGAERTAGAAEEDDVAGGCLDAFVERGIDEVDHLLVERVERLFAVEQDGAQAALGEQLDELVVVEGGVGSGAGARLGRRGAHGGGRGELAGYLAEPCIGGLDAGHGAGSGGQGRQGRQGGGEAGCGCSGLGTGEEGGGGGAEESGRPHGGEMVWGASKAGGRDGVKRKSAEGSPKLLQEGRVVWRRASKQSAQSEKEERERERDHRGGLPTDRPGKLRVGYEKRISGARNKSCRC